MKTIKKSEIIGIEVILMSSYEINERGENYMASKTHDGINVRVDTTFNSDMYKVSEDFIHVSPHILINEFVFKIYETDLEAMVAYTKVVEQLNNPNVEYISF